MSDITITGTIKLSEELLKMADLQPVKDAILKNTADLQNEAQYYVAVDTGALKRSIMMEILDNGFTGRVYSDMAYAGPQEYGTRFQPGTPFLRPALKFAKANLRYDLYQLGNRGG